MLKKAICNVKIGEERNIIGKKFLDGKFLKNNCERKILVKKFGSKILVEKFLEGNKNFGRKMLTKKLRKKNFRKKLWKKNLGRKILEEKFEEKNCGRKVQEEKFSLYRSLTYSRPISYRIKNIFDLLLFLSNPPIQ